MKLELIPCPKCNNGFPKKRKELGYHVCISCSTIKPVVGITTVEGSGDHTYNDIIIMDQDVATSIANAEADSKGKKVYFEEINYDDDESVKTQLVKESVHNVLDENLLE